VILALCWIGTLAYTLRPAATPRHQSTSLAVLAWSCLGVAVLTGWFMLQFQGLSWATLVSGAAFQGRFGRLLSTKLVLVGLLLGLQVVVSRGQRSIRLLQLAAGIAVLVLSVAIVR